MPTFPLGVGSSFFLPLLLSSSFFFPNPNNLRFPCFPPSDVVAPSCSTSLLSADRGTETRFDSWKPSPSRGTLEVFATGWLPWTGVLGCKVLASEALMFSRNPGRRGRSMNAMREKSQQVSQINAEVCQLRLYVGVLWIACTSTMQLNLM